MTQKHIEHRGATEMSKITKDEALRVLSEIEELAIDYVAGGANRAIITDGAAAVRRYIEASGVPEGWVMNKEAQEVIDRLTQRVEALEHRVGELDRRTIHSIQLGGSPVPPAIVKHDHVLYETEDANAPDSIKDCNGEVCLGLCKVCGAAERELNERSCNPWRTHDGDRMPDCYAPAQMVEWSTVASPDGAPDEAVDRVKVSRADDAPWEVVAYHSPVLRNGHKTCSAEGLEPETRYAATDDDRFCWQHTNKPVLGPNYWGRQWTVPGMKPAPFSHRYPGDWRDSLMEVIR